MPKLSINGLIERLEEYRNTVGGDAEVRLMSQPNWPFEYSILGVCSDAEVIDVSDNSDRDADPVIYIVEGTQLGYGRRAAWEAAS